jgi:hypothetical protein
VYTSDRFLPDEDAIKIWYELLKDLPYEQVNIAAQKYMTTSHFPPTPADLRAAVTPPPAEWSDAWEKVIGSVRKYGSWDVKAAEESFDDLTAKVVKNLGGFRRICELEHDEMDVLRANFRDIYSRQAKAEAESNQMSPQLREMVGQMLGGSGEQRRLT